MTLAGWALTSVTEAPKPTSLVTPAAQRMPAMMSESKPPQRPSTRIGNSITSRPTLAMPAPLLVAAPIRPATWVPCQLLSVAALPSWHWSGVVQSPGSRASLSRPGWLSSVRAVSWTKS